MANRRGFWPGRAGPCAPRLYARVSTHDQQTLGLQVEAMAAYIKGRGWEAARQVKDVGSGAKERSGREGLLKAARRREIDVVVGRGRAAEEGYPVTILSPVGLRPGGGCGFELE